MVIAAKNQRPGFPRRRTGMQSEQPRKGGVPFRLRSKRGVLGYDLVEQVALTSSDARIEPEPPDS